MCMYCPTGTQDSCVQAYFLALSILNETRGVLFQCILGFSLGNHLDGKEVVVILCNYRSLSMMVVS